MGMTEEAVKARRNYKRQYRSRNRERINRQQREWRANNREKVKQYQEEYWERKGQRGHARLPWTAYGITPDRLEELIKIARSGQNEALVHKAAHMADKMAAEHIILSIKERLSYEHLEFHEQLGRCSLGRTDFYGARRLFFHYLDCALKEQQENNGTEEVATQEKM